MFSSKNVLPKCNCIFLLKDVHKMSIWQRILSVQLCLSVRFPLTAHEGTNESTQRHTLQSHRSERRDDFDGTALPEGVAGRGRAVGAGRINS